MRVWVRVRVYTDTQCKVAQKWASGAQRVWPCADAVVPDPTLWLFLPGLLSMVVSWALLPTPALCEDSGLRSRLRRSSGQCLPLRGSEPALVGFHGGSRASPTSLRDNLTVDISFLFHFDFSLIHILLTVSKKKKKPFWYEAAGVGRRAGPSRSGGDRAEALVPRPKSPVNLGETNFQRGEDQGRKV